MNEIANNQRPRTITHRIEDHTITEEHYRDMHGAMRYDCTIDAPEGRFMRRYTKLEDATSYLRAHLEMAQIKAEGLAAEAPKH